MALLNQSTQVSGQIAKFFDTLRQGQAPQKFTREFLKDIGYKSSNHLAFIPLLKGLGFLTADGSPTQRYRDFLDPTRSSKVLADAISEAYGDIFTIKAKPGKADRKLIAGKYKSTYNLSEVAADRAAGTFLALLDLADPDTLEARLSGASPTGDSDGVKTEIALPNGAATGAVASASQTAGLSRDIRLHYNIQIHLPATKDVEVYNAIFKSMREHLID